METQFLIHTCPKRLWYVEKYLIPSLNEQGIDNILVYNDKDKDGQLNAFLKSYLLIGDKDTWHLQDDIIISKNFRKTAEEHDDGIVCGFCNSYSTGNPGRANMWNMWYSMPCIRIPGDIFKHFMSWMRSRDVQNKFRHYFFDNKHDDVFLQIFLQENYPRLIAYNVAPNMVNHIDHLLGGSLINKDRGQSTEYIMSKYWDEPELLKDIEDKLKRKEEIA